MRSSNVIKLTDVFTDVWLTPPNLIKALGQFDLDPCCPNTMPWKIAKKMICLPKDGLKAQWHGRVWCNPPYSNSYPWVEKMAEHNNGIMLIPGKSPDTRWCQLAYKNCTGALFLSGRLLFFRQDGTKSKGKWMPNILLAFGEENAIILRDLPFESEYKGIYFRRME